MDDETKGDERMMKLAQVYVQITQAFICAYMRLCRVMTVTKADPLVIVLYVDTYFSKPQSFYECATYSLKKQ